MRRRNGVNLRAIVAKDIPNVAVLHACCFEDPRYAEENARFLSAAGGFGLAALRAGEKGGAEK